MFSDKCIEGSIAEKKENPLSAPNLRNSDLESNPLYIGIWALIPIPFPNSASSCKDWQCLITQCYLSYENFNKTLPVTPPPAIANTSCYGKISIDFQDLWIEDPKMNGMRMKIGDGANGKGSILPQLICSSAFQRHSHRFEWEIQWVISRMAGEMGREGGTEVERERGRKRLEEQRRTGIWDGDGQKKGRGTGTEAWPSAYRVMPIFPGQTGCWFFFKKGFFGRTIYSSKYNQKNLRCWSYKEPIKLLNLVVIIVTALMINTDLLVYHILTDIPSHYVVRYDNHILIELCRWKKSFFRKKV